MDTYTKEEAKDQLDKMLYNAVEERRHCRITSERGAVVLLPEETYRNLAVTLELLSTPGLLDSVSIDYDAQEAAS